MKRKIGTAKITPSCRETHGKQGALEEAAQRLMSLYMKACRKHPDADLSVTITAEVEG